MALKKCETGKKCIDCLLFPDINHLINDACTPYILKLLKIKSLLLFQANRSAF